MLRNEFDPSMYLSAAKDLRNNPGQLAAYNSAGHCVVLAGPGSGKTKTLTLKLARFLAEDVHAPRGVACITYNNECVREIESRLEALGIEPGGRLFIGTVHSFCLTQIILPYAKSADLGLPDGFSVATDDEQDIALRYALDRTIGMGENPNQWKFSLGNYRRLMEDQAKPSRPRADLQLARLAEAYETELRRMGRIDFDDMPRLGLQALRRNEWLRRALFAKYPVLVVDEYQDLGVALHRIVETLCFDAGVRLFAVGDPDQSIYGFMGARPQLLKDLSEREGVERIRLRLNYRCGSRIVEASNYALGEERNYEAAEGAEQGTIYFNALPGDYSSHANHLFSNLLPDIRQRLPALELADIAILYSAAWIGDHVAIAAERHDLPVLRTDRNSIYPRSSRLLRWLEECAEWCSGGWQSGIPRFTRLVNEANRLFAEAVASDDERLVLHRQLMMVLWELRDVNLPLYDWLYEIRGGLIANLIARCPSLSQERAMLDNFMIRTADGGDCSTMALGEFVGQAMGQNCINLSTLHSSKGREFSVVIMFAMDGGRIPRPNATARERIEARRLFYVGFTRAKTELHLLCSQHRPSPFLLEVQKRLDEAS